MIVGFLLLFVGQVVNAPLWYFILCGIHIGNQSYKIYILAQNLLAHRERMEIIKNMINGQEDEDESNG